MVLYHLLDLVGEWLSSGLQNRVHRSESGPGLLMAHELVQDAAAQRLAEIAKAYGVQGSASKGELIKARELALNSRPVDRVLAMLGLDYIGTADFVARIHQERGGKRKRFSDYYDLIWQVKEVWKSLPGGREQYSPLRLQAAFNKAKGSKAKWEQAQNDEIEWKAKYGPGWSLMYRILSDAGLEVEAKDGTKMLALTFEGLPPYSNDPALNRANARLQQIPIIGIPGELTRAVIEELGQEFLPNLKKLVTYSCFENMRRTSWYTHKPNRYDIPNSAKVAREIWWSMPGYDHPYSYMKPKGTPRPSKLSIITQDGYRRDWQLAQWHRIVDRWNRLKTLLKEHNIESHILELGSSRYVTTKRRY